ncbi:hypothetical protein EV175_004340 [Coemansia sp. RSA 1933]|nr:hypothetical protein EV175_004340 [Coemansia sp. RSA 1933]
MTNTAKSASPSASDPKHGHVHTKTETVVVVGSQIPKSEAINKSTIPSPPLLSDQQDLASVLSRSGIQLRLSNADNLTYATPTYFHATTPAPTPNHHDAGAFVPRSTSTNSTAHVDSASMPIYSTNPNEKRVTNGNGNNFAGNKPYKLADGFICLIIIGLVFILATLFYLFMRYRRRQRLRMAQGINGSSSSSKLMCGVADSPGPSSKQSSSSDEDRYQHRRPPVNEKRQRYVPDSGTELANRRNKPENNGEKAFRDSSTAAITMYPLQVPPKTRETEHERVIHIDEQDSYAAGKIDQAYIDYRTKGTVANAEKHEDMRLVKAQTKEPSASNGTRWVEPKHESENNSANKNIRALREPAKVLLPSSENRIHNASSPESKLPEIRLCTPDKSKAGSGNNKERSAAQNEPATGSSNKAKKRHALLDTSSVNPGIMSPLKSDELQGQLQKPRKLVRGSTKRDKRSSGSLGKDVDDDSKKRSRSTDHHNSNLSLRAMFRAPQPCQKDSRKEKETRQRDHSHGADSSDSDTDRKDVEEKRRGEQLLTDSIESISDNYQLAVRHKPPLGPLRAVEPHVPVLPDELVVERSDRMYVFGEFADGWVLAMNISRRSDLGMVPRRCMFFPTAPFMTEEAIMASHASTNPEEV